MHVGMDRHVSFVHTRELKAWFVDPTDARGQSSTIVRRA